MDRVGADFHKSINDIRTKLKGNAHALFLPIGAEENFTGMVDLVHMIAYMFDDTKDPLGLEPQTAPIPAGMLAEAGSPLRGRASPWPCRGSPFFPADRPVAGRRAARRAARKARPSGWCPPWAERP